ncbi:MAG: aminotransferase class I/II-fold pyridoxal phosphate-dependent enzyme [Oscillospiraceae bacterium]|nr:aminotransferase class I/II-fold pyridoxal phosphate-dependent enzyme [Oscillospiraceae bacterium]
MIRFNNDYNHGAFESVLKELAATNGTSYAGYGEDEWCAKAESIIKKLVSNEDALIKFVPGATQANLVVISAALSPVQSVIAADTGHINCHEAASIENTGHKILELPNTDGKIDARQIAACAAAYYDGGTPEYLTEPKMVYLSFPTEKGTLYSKRELREISEVCKRYGMYLFVDGARMGYGLGSERNDLTLRDFAELCDVFYIGGTKCGALFGEALVITEASLKYRFKAHMKQNGAVLAKGWLMGLQFAVMLQNGEYFERTKRADELAMQIKTAFERKGVPFWVDSFTNQQFVILSDSQKEALAKGYYFEEEGTVPQGTVVRFCTSWATTQAEVDALVADIAKL